MNHATPSGSTESVSSLNFDFGSASTPGFFDFLRKHRIALAVTSYNAHRVIVFRIWNDNADTLLVPALRPLGLAFKADRLAVGTISEIIEYRRHDDLLATPEAKTQELGHADALFLPLTRHVTGKLNLHDMAWISDELWFVNSEYSCLCTLEQGYHFRPRWTPFFIDSPIGQNFNHLNGMAIHDGKPAFASCFIAEKTRKIWKDYPGDATPGGLIDVQRNELVIDGLLMPHSPRVHDGHLYFCHSGFGRVERIHLASGRHETVLELPGYTRGLNFYKNTMLVCTSRVRESDTPVNTRVREYLGETIAAIYLIDLDDFSIIDYTQFTGDVSQLYDIVVLEDMMAPAIPGLQDTIVADLHSYPLIKNNAS